MMFRLFNTVKNYVMENAEAAQAALTLMDGRDLYLNL